VDPSRIVESFPAPSFRGAQRRALEDVRSAFEAGNDVVLVRAPTGSGKSLLARAIAGCARRAGEGAPSAPTGAYYTTPQVSQLDDVEGDDLLADLEIVRGKGNYDCILPGETSTPVDRAPCARERGFECPVVHRCPYFADRTTAAEGEIAAMTLAYFMRTAGSEIFGERDVVVIDEAHGLAEWAEMYATIELSPESVPVWGACRPPEIEDLSDVESYAERLLETCSRRQEELRGRVELTESEAEERDRLAELVRELGWFLEDLEDPESPTVWVADQSERAERDDPRGGAVSIKPLDPARYLRHTVWDRGRRFALLSATILDKRAFCRGAGLDPDRVALVEVPHTFPVENRPLYDVTCGKMTYERREETLPAVARTIVRLLAKHDDEKGLVHAHSYAIADRLRELLGEFGVGERVRGHGRENRDAALAGWKRTDDPDIFVSVKMEEALDLDGDLCRWQVICKAPYPNTGDPRVEKRLEDGQWAWYYRSALRTVIQACGRVVRAPDDYGATYLADSSLLDLFERASADVPPWFQSQIDRLTDPALPPFDPDAATPNESGGRPRGRDRSGNSMDDHPLSDVWGED